MKYLCLDYSDAEKFDRLSAGEQKAIGRECQPHDEALRKSGRLVAVASLEHRRAAGLRPGKGGPRVLDRPSPRRKS